MKATELRLNNLIKTDVSDFHLVTIKDLEYLLEDELDDFYQPIPLTEEWLLKFGFVIGEYYKNYKIQTGFGWHSIKKFDDHWVYSIDESDAGCYTVALLEDVHELQNIHFVLSGFELTIN
jgi:hypothetical protein